MGKLDIGVHALILTTVVVLPGCDQGDALAQQGQDRTVQERLGEVPTTVDTTTAASLSRTFRAAAATALPSVVTVQVTAQPRTAGRSMPFPFPFGQPNTPQQEAPPQMGTGSGFVFTEEGHIVTNNHVVANATDLQIQFPDGRIYDDVEVVGRDPNTDIAVVKIQSRNGNGFTPLAIGSSDRLQVGDWVLALGNPLNLGFTVTAGIVSAKGRSLQILQGDFPLESFIQTDAAINRGNSGGPLVDLYGRVVGVNTAIYSQTGLYAGNGFAVPSSIAAKAARDIIEYGYVRRPMVGIQITPVGEAQAELYELDRIAGAVVSAVVPGGPAEEAGIEPEDVIVSLDGTEVEDDRDLITRLARREPGEEVTLGIVRNGRRIEIEVELGQFDVQRPETRTASTEESAEAMLGLRLADLADAPPRILQELELGRNAEGVVVLDVAQYGPAAGRIVPGDVILEFNRQPIRSVADLQRLARDVDPGDIVVLRVRGRDATERVVSFRLR